MLAAQWIDAEEKHKWIKRIEEKAEKSAVKDPDWKTNPYEHSDPVVRAWIARRIYTGDIDESTKDEVFDLVGQGLSVSDAERYAAKIDKHLKESRPERTPETERAYKLLDRWRADRAFSSDKEENNLGWARAAADLERYIAEHPGEDPLPWLEQYLKPVGIGFWDRLFGANDVEPVGNTMPSPVGRQGEVLIDALTGKKYRSDGRRWIPVAQ